MHEYEIWKHQQELLEVFAFWTFFDGGGWACFHEEFRDAFDILGEC